MEGGGSVNIVMIKCFVLILIGMLAAVHAQVMNQAEAEAPPFSSSQTSQGFISDEVIPRLTCSEKCNLKCRKKRVLSRVFCGARCMGRCIISPTDAAYACTNNCVTSTFTRDVNNVEEFVDSCYKKCSKNL